MEQKGKLVVISGFSGAGKGTLMKALLAAHPDRYALSVSATTRDPRPGEKDAAHHPEVPSRSSPVLQAFSYFLRHRY